MRYIRRKDSLCGVREMCSLKVRMADRSLRRTNVNDMIADEVLRSRIICKRASQEILNSWQAFKDASQPGVVRRRCGCKNPVEQWKGFRVKHKSVEVQCLANCFDFVYLRSFDWFWEKVIRK